MKHSSRTCDILANLTALTLAVFGATCQAANNNVWISSPANDQSGEAYWTWVICVWPDLFVGNQQIGLFGNAWDWPNATMTEYGAPPSCTPCWAWNPEFDTPTNLLVKVAYHGVWSAGVNCTIVCPEETVAAGDSFCAITNSNGTELYWWGGTFVSTFWFKDQNGTELMAAGVYLRELPPEDDPSSDCPYAPFYYTEKALVIPDNGQVPDQISLLTAESPPWATGCTNIATYVVQFSATGDEPWVCDIEHTNVLSVAQPQGNSVVTVTKDGKPDPPADCGFPLLTLPPGGASPSRANRIAPGEGRAPN
jgi:hypothetical protein